MAVGIDVFTAGRVWTIKYNGSTATHTLPYTLCPYDLIPKRVVWRSVTGAADDTVILQSQPTGGTATDVFREVCSGADFNPQQEAPYAHEQWSGPIVVTQFDSGELLITI